MHRRETRASPHEACAPLAMRRPCAHSRSQPVRGIRGGNVIGKVGQCAILHGVGRTDLRAGLDGRSANLCQLEHHAIPPAR